MERRTRDDGPRTEEVTTQLTRDLRDIPKFIAEMNGLLLIDERRLDKNVREQVTATSRINEVYAMILSRRDEAEDLLKEIEAELNETIREDFTRDGKKPTVEQLKFAVRRHTHYTRQQRRLAQLREDTNRLAGVKDVWKGRSYMVRELVTLQLSGYFADMSGTKRDVPSVNSRRDEDRRDDRRRRDG